MRNFIYYIILVSVNVLVLSLPFPSYTSAATDLELIEDNNFGSRLGQKVRAALYDYLKKNPTECANIYGEENCNPFKPYPMTTLRNESTGIFIGGKDIFLQIRDMISKAEKEVFFLTYSLVMPSDPVDAIFEGLKSLERRLKTMKVKKPVTVWLVFDTSDLLPVHYTPRSVRPVIFEVLKRNFDDNLVNIKVVTRKHLFLGAMHAKLLIIDGKMSLITGANPQPNNNFDHPQHDLGFSFTGEVSSGLLYGFSEILNSCHVREFNCEEYLALKEKPDYELDELVNTCNKLFSCGVTEYRSTEDILNPEWEQTWFTNLPILPVTYFARSANGFFKGNADNAQSVVFHTTLKEAKEEIHILTPNLNEYYFKEAIAKEAMRGLKFKIILSKGFNDGMEKFDGGTNNDFYPWLVNKFKGIMKGKELKAIESFICSNIQIKWYGEKEGEILDDKKCPDEHCFGASHAKYMSADDLVAIIGSANHDRQSWRRSHEKNLFVDHGPLVKEYEEKIFMKDWKTSTTIEPCQNIK